MKTFHTRHIVMIETEDFTKSFYFYYSPEKRNVFNIITKEEGFYQYVVSSENKITKLPDHVVFNSDNKNVYVKPNITISFSNQEELVIYTEIFNELLNMKENIIKHDGWIVKDNNKLIFRK